MWTSSHIDWINIDVNIDTIHVDYMLTVNPGLAGVVAFDTEIAEPDRAGGALRYRGGDLRELGGGGGFPARGGRAGGGGPPGGGAPPPGGPSAPPPPPAEPYPIPVHSGDIRVDVQAAVSML